ncbi:deoxyguanosinetriphosphate triphosphohydrolase [Chloroflexota bacterium]
MVNWLNIRQITENREENLSAYAVQSKLSRGRDKVEEPCPVRTAFQRDRDRIIHCNAFRRLKHKTQVFISPLSDHYVTRLTHTLEVSQVARTIVRALSLNEDLVEAISLGHDLGHTPFGHIGEDVLDALYHGGFHHNEQSLRVVDTLENNGQGLNLTWEVRDGILNHSKSKANIFGPGWGEVGTLEGEVCKLADIVAYINHDIDDAVRAGIVSEKDLPSRATEVLGKSRSQRINTMVCDIIQNSWAVSGGSAGEDKLVITMSASVTEAANKLRDFLFDKVYNVCSSQEEAEQAKEMIRLLYCYFTGHEDRVPVEYCFDGDDVERRAVDYIAGMTDQYAVMTISRLAMGGTHGS